MTIFERRSARRFAQLSHAGAIAAALCCIVLPDAAAQGAAPDAGAKQAFEAAFFTPLNPVTAEDMVKRVPGFTLRDGEDRRGLAGAAGNVLINGERPSSKIPLSEQLSRISARDVLRIDLRTGGADAADMRGESVIADVVLKPRQGGATNTFVAQASLLEPGNTINPLLVANSGFRAGGANVSISLQAQPSRRGRIEYEKELRSPSGALIEQADEYVQGNYWEYKLSSRASFALGGRDTFNINGQWTPSQDGRHTLSDVRSPTGTPRRVVTTQMEGDASWAGELGADWEHRFSGTSSFKLVGLARLKETGSDEAVRIYTPAGLLRTTVNDRSASSGEYVGRASFGFQPFAGHTMDIGLEGALNFLDSGLGITDDTGAGPVVRPLPVANTRVEEERVEANIADVWRAAPGLSVEMGVAVELSTITQTGDAAQERDFTYVKPRLKATWDPSGPSQFRLLLERDVAQLDFVEFASAISEFDGVVSVGNPGLEPEKTWRAQLDWEHRWGPKGAVVLSAFHDRVEDVQDQIPIGVFDGPGNLGDGERTGVKLDMTAPMDWLGLTGGELRVRGLAQETSVTDPTTGLDRRFSDETEWSYSIDYRQPLPGLKMLWGLLYERADDVQVFRRAELRTTGWQDPNLDLYIETTAIKGLVIRATLNDVLLPAERREVQAFAPNRSVPANLSTIETRDAFGGYGTRSLAIRVSGRF